MVSLPPNHPGLPTSPRTNRQMQMLSPLDTSFPTQESHSTSSPYSSTSEKPLPQSLIDTRHRNCDSLIFVNATIPLSPASSTTSSLRKDEAYNGLAPRKRSGLARLFCCFGREERARRRVIRDTEFEKVGEPLHWSEY